MSQAMYLHYWVLSSEFALRHAAKVQTKQYSAGKNLLNCCGVAVICVIVRRKHWNGD